MTPDPMPAHGMDANDLEDPQERPMVTFDGRVECILSVVLVRDFTKDDVTVGEDMDDAQDEACKFVRDAVTDIVAEAIDNYLRAHPEHKLERCDIDILTTKVED